MRPPRPPSRIDSIGRRIAGAVVVGSILVACPQGQVQESAPPSASTHATTSPAADAPTNPTSPRTIVPKGLVHVTFEGIDEAPSRALGWREAAARKSEVDAALAGAGAIPGHRRWFFHAFDRDTLVFFVGRWEPRAPVGGVFHAEEVLVVRRSGAAERGLAVDAILREYEVGAAGLRAGMRPEEVEAEHGAPSTVIQLGPFGAFDYAYADVCVRFLDGQVAHLWPPDRCAGAGTSR